MVEQVLVLSNMKDMMLRSSFYLNDTGHSKHVEHDFHCVFLVFVAKATLLAGGEKHSGFVSMVDKALHIEVIQLLNKTKTRNKEISLESL